VAGSTLKPFIYADAINGGLLTAETMLLDVPVRYGNYLPENYARTFRGPVPADEALSLSLNIPAIRLLASLGLERVIETLQALELLPPGTGYSEKDGLSLALGTSGHTLLSLTAAYAALANGGTYRPPSFLSQADCGSPQPVFHPGTAVLISQMLRTHQLRGTSLPLAWKTGTSNGNHDAWCFAYTPDYTLGIWFGNKDGHAAAALVGSEAAAPCVAAVFEAIYRDQRPTAWPDRDDYLQETKLCQRSGLRASPICLEQKDGFSVRGIPLTICHQCQTTQQREPLQILSPRPVNYQLPRGQDTVKITFRTNAQQELSWFLDGQFLGPIPPGHQHPIPKGRHSLSAISSDGISTATVRFSVE
jgi:penicillin-binding protein 1C